MIRIFVGLTLLLVAEIGIRITNSALSPLQATLPNRPIGAIPKEVDGWVAEDIPLDQPIFEHSGAATMLDRSYQNAVGDLIGANFGIWLHDGIGLPHSPEICYRGGGWELGQKSIITIPCDQSGVVARFLKFEKSGQIIYVLCCYQVGDRFPKDSGELRAIRQSLRGSKKPMPPIVKMMLQSGHPNPEMAKRQLTELAALLLPFLAEYK